MSEKRVFCLVHATARQGAMHAVAHAPQGYVVEIKPKTRSLEQNARMWALLTEISKQVEWHGKRLSPDAWKCVFSASLKKQDVVPGLSGDFVVIGQSTSQMSIREMNDLMTLMEAFGAERGVRFEEECPA
jgi:hypothetical protein